MVKKIIKRWVPKSQATGKLTGATRKIKKDVAKLKKIGKDATRIIGLTASQNTATVPFLGSVLQYSSVIVEGDAVTNREGTKLSPQWIKGKYTIITTTANCGSVRFIWFQDRDAQGVVPVVTDVLASAFVTSAYSVLNVHQNKRFRILKDIIVDASQLNAPHLMKTVRFFIKKPSTVNFLNNNGNATSAGKNTIYVLVIGGITDATNQPQQSPIAWTMNSTMQFDP